MKILGLVEVSEGTAQVLLNVSVAILLLILLNWLLKEFFNIDILGGIKGLFGGSETTTES